MQRILALIFGVVIFSCVLLILLAGALHDPKRWMHFVGMAIGFAAMGAWAYFRLPSLTQIIGRCIDRWNGPKKPKIWDSF